jgi:hypothetical protein
MTTCKMLKVYHLKFYVSLAVTINLIHMSSFTRFKNEALTFCWQIAKNSYPLPMGMKQSMNSITLSYFH